MSLVLAAAALLGASLPAAPARAGTEHGVNRVTLAKRAKRAIEKRRTIRVLRISRCGPRRREGRVDRSKWLCEWRAKGVWPGEVPYRCTGTAVWKRTPGSWRIARCENQMQPRIPLLPDPGPAPRFGYNDDWGQRSNATFELLAQTRPEVARAPLAWASVESRQGEYDWSYVDRAYGRLHDRGIRPLWALIEAPCWAQPDPAACRGGNNQLRPAPEHYAALADFAAAAARRYPESVGIEVWNEPNYSRFWGGEPQPALYAEMLIEAAGAIHATAPGMPVISAGLSPHSDSDPEAIGFASFLSKLYAHGAAQKADAIGAHPYPSVGPGGDYVDAMRIHLGKVEKIMSQNGEAAKPIWATEFGVSTAGSEAFSLPDQGQALAELYSTLRRVEGLPVVVVHRFLEQPHLDGREAGFGVIAGDEDGLLGVLPSEFDPKPAYCALNQVRGVAC